MRPRAADLSSMWVVARTAARCSHGRVGRWDVGRLRRATSSGSRRARPMPYGARARGARRPCPQGDARRCLLLARAGSHTACSRTDEPGSCGTGLPHLGDRNEPLRRWTAVPGMLSVATLHPVIPSAAISSERLVDTPQPAPATSEYLVAHRHASSVPRWDARLGLGACMHRTGRRAIFTTEAGAGEARLSRPIAERRSHSTSCRSTSARRAASSLASPSCREDPRQSRTPPPAQP